MKNINMDYISDALMGHRHMLTRNVMIFKYCNIVVAVTGVWNWICIRELIVLYCQAFVVTLVKP